jgi:histidine triad (HIT) family protein
MIQHRSGAVVVHEDEEILAVMDRYPATPGHVLVLPKEHIENIYAIPAELGARIMATAIAVAKAIKQKISIDGLNLIQSSELAAGQTIAHFHLHIVPRYNSDPVSLRFGHGNVPAKINDLEKVASLISSALVIR